MIGSLSAGDFGKDFPLCEEESHKKVSLLCFCGVWLCRLELLPPFWDHDLSPKVRTVEQRGNNVRLGFGAIVGAPNCSLPEAHHWIFC